jgi:hypothetical protein
MAEQSTEENQERKLTLTKIQHKPERQGRAVKKTHKHRKAMGTHKGEHKHMHSRAQQHRAENL